MLSALAVFVFGHVAQAGWSPVVTDQRVYSAAIVDLAGGRLEDAVSGFTALLDKDPSCGMALHGRGMAHLRQGDLTAAATDLKAVVAAYPGRPEGHTGLSTVRFAQQDFAGAAAAARAALSASPGDIDAQSALQQVFLRTGDLDGARVALTSAADALPAPIVACFEVQLAQEAGDTQAVEAQLGNCRSAGVPALVAAAISRASGDSAIVGEMAGELGVQDLLLHAQAVDLFNDGEYAQAVRTLDKVLDHSPHRADARLLRARARYASGDATGALDDLETAFDAETWVDVHRSGAMSGILRKSDEDALNAEVIAGAGLLVGIHVDVGSLESARARLESFEAELGQPPALMAAGARLLRAEGQPEAAWTRVEDGLRAHSGDPILVRLASQWAVAHPDEVSSTLAAQLVTSGSWQDAWNLAISKRTGGDLAGCHDTAAQALTSSALAAPPDSQRKLAGLAHRCAVAGEALTNADALVDDVGGPDAIDPLIAFNHARLRQASGDALGAISLLGKRTAAPPTGQPDVARAIVALGIRAHLDADQLTKAADLAAGKWAVPADQLVVASRLAVTDNDTAAKMLLDQACPKLQGDDLDRCTRLKATLVAQ